ncbi:hypothetical protein ACET3Z_004278 [Daucus carota]
MVVQHLELPYGSELLPSLLLAKVSNSTKRAIPVGEEASDNLSVTNQSFKDGLGLVSSNQTSVQNKGGNIGELKDGGSSVGNGMQERPRDAEQNVSSNGFSERGNFSRPSNQNGSSDSGLAPVTSAEKNTYSGPNGVASSSSGVVMPIAKMDDMLHQSYSSPHSLPSQFYTKVDKNLVEARSHIENSPIIHNDTDLHAPLYRNLSMFKRSYEIMEGQLKVYIYKEGEKPIFHDFILDGIYSSEGWFLKLLEANKQFVTQDPGEAHLFYFPFSSRLLQLTLYKKRSHNRKNLIQYMENYLEMLIAKYPYWNRTDGADHFLAACHDWAPSETRGRMLNCIRALCNSDVTKGFAVGKDVSLPTIYVQSPQNPLRDIGGNPPLERPILAFFAGYMHGKVRPVLLQHWGNDPDMRIITRMPHVKGNKNYIDNMRSSKYCICPRGYEVNSPRVVESIFYECVPVIISDNYVPPLFEVLNWESLAVFILERDIPNMKSILLSISEEKYLEMQNRVKWVQKHFLWHAEPLKYDMFHMILHSIWYNRVFQIAPV